MTALVTQRGARVLGIFPAHDAENLLWTNEAIADSDHLRSFVAAGGWNLGGERCWIAPEIQYNATDRRDFFGTLDVPKAIDPGQYGLSLLGDGVRFDQTITLTAYNLAEGEKRLRVERAIQPIANPLPSSAMDNLVYAGYEQTVTLSELNDTPILSAVWNLVQLNAGGTLILPYYGALESAVYFGSAPDEARSGANGILRIAITGKRQFKVGYATVSMTGRMGYWRPLPDGRESLLVRNFFNNPSNLYPEEPPLQPGVNGHSVFVYNDGGEFGGERSFGEMEYVGRTVGAGRSQSTDSFELWAYVGTGAAIRRAARQLLGVEL